MLKCCLSYFSTILDTLPNSDPNLKWSLMAVKPNAHYFEISALTQVTQQLTISPNPDLLNTVSSLKVYCLYKHYNINNTLPAKAVRGNLMSRFYSFLDEA